MRILCLSILLTFTVSLTAYSQTEYRDREFSLINENDVYLLLRIDRYYSNGTFFNYRFSKEKAPNVHLKTKRIYDIGLVQRFWTPQDVRIRRTRNMWRPYAGMTHLALRSSNFYHQNNRFMYGLDIGVVGRASGAQAFQEWYHGLLGFDDPQGWDTQINNGFVIDLKLEYNRQFFLIADKLDLITSTSLSIGNAFTNAVQRMDFRFGKLRNLRQSAFKNALIGEGSNTISAHAYFFAGYGIESVGHNTTIQGHVFKNGSPLTREIVPWVRHLRGGLAINTESYTLKFTYNWLSNELKEDGGRHSYIAIELQLRMMPKK